MLRLCVLCLGTAVGHIAEKIPHKVRLHVGRHPDTEFLLCQLNRKFRGIAAHFKPRRFTRGFDFLSPVHLDAREFAFRLARDTDCFALAAGCCRDADLFNLRAEIL